MTGTIIAYAFIVLAGLGIAALLAKRWVDRRVSTPPSDSADKDKPLPDPTDEFGIRPLSDRTVKYGCGHEGHTEYVGHFYGLELEPTKEALKSREKCPQCVADAMRDVTIHCALCGLPIFPGEPVALYAGPKKAFRKEPGWVTKHDGQAVGCLRWDCCPSGGFFAGHWDGERVRSAFAGGSAAGEALRTGQVIVCGDVSDPDSVKRLDPGPERDPDGDGSN